MSNPEFDFAQKPLNYRIADGLNGFFGKKKTSQKLAEQFDKLVYFKIESRRTVVGELSYLVFYNDSSIVCPDLSPKQLKEVIAAKKGYIGFVQNYDKIRNRQVNKYTVKALERAHSYPCNINLDALIETNAVIPLQ